MENKLIMEDGEACANGSNTAGMGSVVAAQPSTNPGVTSGPDFNGTIGSGDVSNPSFIKPTKKKKKKHIKKFDELYEPKQNWTKGYDNTSKIMTWDEFNESLDENIS
jgi:hypothetical protein